MEERTTSFELPIPLPRAVRAVGDFPILGEGGAEVGRQILVPLRERADPERLRDGDAGGGG